MKRRSILTSPAALIAVAALPRYARAVSLTRGVRVAAGQDRFGQHIPLGTSRAIDRKVSAEDTSGIWSTFESLWQGKGGPPLHVHHGQEEWFYVLEGDFVFQVGEEKFNLTSGDSVLAPRQLPHTFAHMREARGRILSAFQPAGDIEMFFREYGKLAHAPSPEQAQRLFRAYGMEIVGPPLKV